MLKIRKKKIFVQLALSIRTTVQQNREKKEREKKFRINADEIVVHRRNKIAIFEKSNASILFKEIARFPKKKVCYLFNIKAEK